MENHVMTENLSKEHLEKLDEITKKNDNIRTTLRIPLSIFERLRGILPNMKIVDFFDLLSTDLESDIIQSLMREMEKKESIGDEVRAAPRKSYFMRRNTSESFNKVSELLGIPRDILITRIAKTTLHIYEYDRKKRLAQYTEAVPEIGEAIDLLGKALVKLEQLREGDWFVEHIVTGTGYLEHALEKLDNYRETGIWEEN
jgi:hypothetical protein